MVPLACGIVLLAALRPPAIGRRPARVLDLALILALGAIVLQLVPLPAAVRGRLAPAALAYDRAMRFNADAASAAPISVDPGATLVRAGGRGDLRAAVLVGPDDVSARRGSRHGPGTRLDWPVREPSGDRASHDVPSGHRRDVERDLSRPPACTAPSSTATTLPAG